jgi:hypothetical protein
LPGGICPFSPGSDGTIEVTELAGFVDQKVPELSFEALKQRQVPQDEAGWIEFCRGQQGRGARPGGRGRQRGFGTSVAIVRTEAGWTVIAKDGKALGYVTEASLAPIQ